MFLLMTLFRRHGVDLLNKRIRFYFLPCVSVPIYSISFLTEQPVFNMHNCRSLILKVPLKSILWMWSGILMQFWQFRFSPNLLQGARTDTEKKCILAISMSICISSFQKFVFFLKQLQTEIIQEQSQIDTSLIEKQFL